MVSHGQVAGEQLQASPELAWGADTVPWAGTGMFVPAALLSPPGAAPAPPPLLSHPCGGV